MVWGFFKLNIQAETAKQTISNLGMNTQNTATAVIQAFNLCALTYCVCDLYNNPDKLAKVGLDIAIHTATYLALGLEKDLNKDRTKESTTGEALVTLPLMALNLMQIGVIYAGVTSSCPAIQTGYIEGALDSALHVANTISLI